MYDLQSLNIYNFFISNNIALIQRIILKLNVLITWILMALKEIYSSVPKVWYKNSLIIPWNGLNDLLELLI